jgi:hypothetical protein
VSLLSKASLRSWALLIFAAFFSFHNRVALIESVSSGPTGVQGTGAAASLEPDEPIIYNSIIIIFNYNITKYYNLIY